MKRFVLLLALCFASVMGYSQSGYESVCDIKVNGFTDGEIVFVEGYGYYLFGSTDNGSGKTATSVYLGSAKESAIKTIDELTAFRLNGDDGDVRVMAGYGNATASIRVGKSFGIKTLAVTVDGVAGKSTALYCVTCYPNNYVKAILGFNE